MYLIDNPTSKMTLEVLEAVKEWYGGNYMIKFKYEKATDTLPINGVLACAINGLLEKDLFKKLIEKSSLEYTEQEVDKSYIYRINVSTSKDLEKTHSLIHSFGLYLGEFNTLRMWNNLIKEFKVTIKKTVEYTTYLTLNHLQDAYEEAEREMDRLDISEYEEVDSEITVEEQ